MRSLDPLFRQLVNELVELESSMTPEERNAQRMVVLTELQLKAFGRPL